MNVFRTWGIGPAFVLLALLLFMRADHPEFLFDSAEDVIVNPETHSLSRAWNRYQANAFKPGPNQLGHLSFALSAATNRTLGQPDFEVSGFLVANTILHGLNAWLLFLLLGRLAPGLPLLPRFLLATLFLVHPLQLNSVACIMQRQGLLATLFYLAAILTYLRAMEWPGKKRWLGLIAVAGLFVLSYTSKAMALTLPFMIAGIELIRRAPDREKLRSALPYLGAACVLTLVMILTFLSQQGLFELGGFKLRMWGADQQWGVGVQLLSEARAFLHYWKLIWLPVPGWMSIDHDFAPSYHVLEHGALFAVLFHFALFALTAFAIRKGRTLIALGIAWFYITLIPYAILPQVALYVEYKTYLPMIGAILLLAGLSENRPTRPACITLGALSLVLILLCWNRATVFQSAEALWRDAANKAPNKGRPLTDYAAALVVNRKYDEALRVYRLAIERDPTYVKAHNNLGNLLVDQGKLDAGITHLQNAIYMNPRFAEAHNNLGRALGLHGQLAEAERFIRKALALKYHYPDAHTNLGNVLAERKQTDQALKAYRDALAIQPDHGDARYNLASVHADRGEYAAAIAELNTLAKATPPHPMAAKSLSVIWVAEGDRHLRAGQHQHAIQSWKNALLWDPASEAAKIRLKPLQ